MKTLDWKDVYRLGTTDNAKRWYPHEEIAPYFGSIRSPSAAWPWSYAKAAQTQKFAKWLLVNRPEVAKRFGLIEGEAA
jgi:hypothetical protein